MASNAYVVCCPRTRLALLVDAGGDPDVIIRALRAREAVPILLVNTHGHADHIAANAQLKATFPELRLAIHSADARQLTSVTANLSFFLGVPVRSPAADILLDDCQKVCVGEMTFQVLHTPGHTPGSICLYGPAAGTGDPPVVFTGDTLFAGGVGRTDFPGGSADLLLRSIRERLLPLAPETVVYPGHGPATTIGRETRENSFLQVDVANDC